MNIIDRNCCIFYYSLICWLISSTGLIWESSSLSSDYFKYETINQLFITRPTVITPPALDMCSQLANYWVENRNQTVNDFLRQSSPVNQVMWAVDHRVPPTFEYKFHFQAPINPMNVIKIEKYLKNKFGCYSFQLQPNYSTEFNYHHLTNDFNKPIIYTIHILPQSSFGQLTSFWYPFMHPSTARGFYQQEDNFIEVYWPRIVWINKTVPLPPVNRILEFSYKLFTSNLLPPPFDTNCKNYTFHQQSSTINNFDSQAHCIESCYNDTVYRVFGLVSTTIPAYEATNHIRFRWWSPEYRLYEEECINKCPQSDCLKEDFIPIILATGKSFIPQIKLYATNAPIIQQESVPKLRLLEYIIYILSCVSFWLGLSPLEFLLKAKPGFRNGRGKTISGNNRGH